MTARLRGLHPKDLTDAQADVYRAITGGPRAGGPFPLTTEEGCLRGPFNAMLLSPPLGLALQAVGTAVRYKSGLSDRLREMAILIVASRWGSDFERESHEAVGRACGVTEKEFAAIRTATLPDLTDPAERAGVRAAAALVENGALTDDEYNEAAEVLGERGLFELTTLVGYYATLALLLRVFGGERNSR